MNNSPTNQSRIDTHTHTVHTLSIAQPKLHEKQTHPTTHQSCPQSFQNTRGCSGLDKKSSSNSSSSNNNNDDDDKNKFLRAASEWVSEWVSVWLSTDWYGWSDGEGRMGWGDFATGLIWWDARFVSRLITSGFAFYISWVLNGLCHS
jgi:hypothetical protein